MKITESIQTRIYDAIARQGTKKIDKLEEEINRIIASKLDDSDIRYIGIELLRRKM